MRNEPELDDLLEEPVNAQTVVLLLKKETKHTFVYASEDEGAFASSVYINKASLPKTPPPVVTLKLSW